MKTMIKKYIIYTLFAFSLFVTFKSSTYAYEATQKLKVDLTEHSVFNIFYELDNGTSLAQVLAENGNNFRGYLTSQYYPDLSGYNDSDLLFSEYAIWLDYATLEDNVNNAYYKITYEGENTGTCSYINYFFDSSMNYLSSNESIEQFCGYDPHKTITIEGMKGYYRLFSYYDGNMKRYLNNDYTRYILHKVDNGTKTYTLYDEDNTSWIVNVWHTLLNNWWNPDNQSLSLEWYKKNTIISYNIPLKPIRETIYNFQDLNMSGYSSILVNDYPNGVVLTPTTTEYDSSTMDFKLYAYTTSTDSYLKGALIPLDNGVADTSNIDFVFNRNFGVMKLSSFAYTNMKNTDIDTSVVNTNWYDYSYYFYTEDTIDDLKLFYDSNSFTLSIPDTNGNVSVYDPSSEEYLTFSTYEAKHNSNLIITTNDIHDGPIESKYPTGIPTSYIDSGGDKSQYLANGSSISSSTLIDSESALTKGKNIISSIGSTLGGLGEMFKACFEAFPDFYNLFIFALTAAIIIGVLKLVF